MPRIAEFDGVTIPCSHCGVLSMVAGKSLSIAPGDARDVKVTSLPGWSQFKIKFAP
jgi:hypothetical protein